MLLALDQAASKLLGVIASGAGEGLLSDPEASLESLGSEGVSVPEIFLSCLHGVQRVLHRLSLQVRVLLGWRPLPSEAPPLNSATWTA